MNVLLATLVVLLYVGVTGYLGWLGYKRTKTASDYLIGGRQVHPFLMVMGYGATFISTSAIVGFGGVAGLFGMGLLWLSVLNIFVGIFIAFTVFGRRTRALGHHIGAHTFPELLGKRFRSKSIQVIAGTIIFLAMPLYAAAVMIGVARFVEQTFPISYGVGLLVFAFLIAFYVFWGGLKGVMYTDGFQGSIMLIGMIFLIVLTYAKLGGIVPAHKALTALASELPDKLVAAGHMGWTSMPALGSKYWWILVSTIVMGVGIGVLAQPQLAVRYMTVSSGKELNRAMGMGGIFLLFTVAAIFVVGSLSNLYFFQTSGKIALAMVVDPVTGKPNIDKIIPLYINSAMPIWFTYIFLLILLSAGMSTLSSLFHTIGTSFGRDIVQQFIKKDVRHTVAVTRVGIMLAFILTVSFAYKLPGSIIAIATAIFFGLCAACFLPIYCGAIFSKRMNKKVALSAMLGGFLTWAFWILFVHIKESSALGICQMIFDKPSLAVKSVVAFIDPIVIALPVSSIIAIVGTMFCKKIDR